LGWAVANLTAGTVRFLYTDIEGSAVPWERDRAALQASILSHDALLAEVITARRGLLYKHVGDVVQAALDAASEALAAAVDSQLQLPAELWPEIGRFRRAKRCTPGRRYLMRLATITTSPA